MLSSFSEPTTTDPGHQPTNERATWHRTESASEDAEAKFKEARRRRYSLRESAAQLLPGERVCKCGWRPVPGESIGIVKRDGRHYLSNIQMCGSVWTCPVCAPKVAKRRSAELREAVSEWEARGGSVLLLTLTIDHVRKDELPNLLDRFTEAMRELWAGGWAGRWRRDLGQVGMVRNLEVTWGTANGWHPHAHALLFIGRHDHPTIPGLCYYAEEDVQDAEARIKARWQAVAARHGFKVSLRRGATLEDVRSPEDAAGYLAGEGKASDWGAAEELTWSHIKQTKGVRYTPFRLLAACDSDDVGAAPALFQTYADAFKGRRQLYWSKGLRELLGLGVEKSDEDAANMRDEQAKLIVAVDTRIYCWIRARGLLCDLLEAADEAGDEGVRAFLEWACERRDAEARERRRWAN